MSWYNYNKWKDTIRKQKETNTSQAFIRGITKFVTSKSLDWHRWQGRNYRDHLEVLIAGLNWFISHSDLANENVYNIVRNIAIQSSGDHDELEYVIDLESKVCTCMPYWFAKAIMNGSLKTPEKKAFNAMSYMISNDVLEDFTHTLPYINTMDLLKNSPIKNKDIFKEFLFTRSREDIINLLSEMNHTNLSNIDHDFMNDIISKYNFVSLRDIIDNMINPLNIFKCSISVMKLYVTYSDVWENIDTKSNIMRAIVSNPILTREEFIDICITIDYKTIDSIHRELVIFKPHIIIDMIKSGELEPTCNVMGLLSYSTKISIDDVVTLQNLPWDWNVLSRNPVISTPENIRKYRTLPWIWGRWGISKSPSLTEDFIEENFDLLATNVSTHTHYTGSLQNNPSVTIKVVESHPEVEWNHEFNGLSSNPNVTVPYFLKNTERYWDMMAIVENIGVCEDTAVRSIQACWRIYKTHQRAKWLARQVVEWFYHPDCKPTMSIRKKHFEDMMDCLFV